jgi:hypothetical protein
MTSAPNSRFAMPWTLISAVLLGCGALASAQAPADPRLDAADFAIMPWNSAPAEKAALEDLRACGFNMAGFAAPAQVDAVAAVGLKCLVADPSVQLDAADVPARAAALAERFAKHPAVLGYYLTDEPGAAAFPALAKWTAALHTAAPKQLAFVNLFPNYASAGQMGVPTYPQYLEAFISQVKPAVVSYDHYALMDDGALRGGYFQNLGQARAAAEHHGLPFWNVVLGNSHFNYAEPSDATLRFQVYTSLAYGARGIGWFTYVAPQVGNYRLAAIDQFGNKTATWDMLRRVNLQIHKLGPTYLRLKSVNVFHHPNVPPECSPLATSRFVADVSGGDLLIGEFEGPQGPAALVVNKSLHKSTPFSIRFKAGGPVRMVSPYTGAIGAWGGENGWLAPGQGMLLLAGK